MDREAHGRHVHIEADLALHVEQTLEEVAARLQELAAQLSFCERRPWSRGARSAWTSRCRPTMSLSVDGGPGIATKW
jgi:hypothetical protein